MGFVTFPYYPKGHTFLGLVMKIHLVGNGPSVSYFDRSQCSKDDIVVGCNFSSPQISPDFVSIIDLSTMRKIVDEPEVRVDYPAVITERCSDYKHNNSKKFGNRLQVLDVVKTRQIRAINKNIPMNSGQHGLLYAIEKHPEVRDIYIWGVDSFWTDSISSTTDDIIKKHKQVHNPRISKIWRNYWNYIFQKYSDHSFHIFALEEFENRHSNVHPFTLPLQNFC
jgi:hypothetical protein